jgi:predicted ATPase/DNA-binding CsgD family transcriptional regulator
VAGESSTCEACRKTIPAPRARYCSGACRQRAYRARARAARNRSALPQPLDSFVGRAAELTEVRRLAHRERLITVTGPAGVGKTRLIREVAAHVQGSFVAIHFVELVAISDPAAVAEAVAEALGGNAADGDPVTKLVARLDDHKVLLLLDNCEQVVDACRALVETISRRCPRSTIVATSREPLEADGEVVYRLDGLAVPEPADSSAVSGYRDSDAVRLFVDRAQAAATNFELTDELAPAVLAICAQLDGLPLAIELAARLVRVLPVDGIAARLRDRLFTLTAEGRAVDGRHRSLYAAIEWSYGLLSADQQRVLRRLSVLVGGFGPEVASATCGDDIADVPGVLGELVTKSMVSSLAGVAGRPRYSMLEAVRQFAHDRLVAAGEEQQAHEALVSWLCAQIEPYLTDFGAELTLFTQELDNAAAELERLEGVDDERRLLLAYGVTARRPTRATQAILARALASSGFESRYRPPALLGAAWSGDWNDPATQLRLAQKAVDLERRWNRPQMLARGVRVVAWGWFLLGDIDSGVAAMDECLRIAEAAGGVHLMIVALSESAWFLAGAGEPDRAARLSGRAIELFRRGGDLDLHVATLHTAGAVALERGDPATAEALLIEAAAGNPLTRWERADVAEGLAIAAARTGRPERALCLLAAAGELRNRPEVGYQGSDWWQDRVGAAADAARAALPPARAAEAEAAGHGLTREELLRYAVDGDAVLPADRGPIGAPLTDRQRRVAQLIAEGRTNREIAEYLHTSVRTVEAEVRTAREALRLGSRTAVGAWAARQRDSGSRQ